MVNNVLKMVQTIVMAYIVSVVLLIVLALVAYRAGMSQHVVTVGVHVVYVLSTCAAGLVIGIKMGKRRTLWGIGAGVLYYMIILAVSIMMDRGITASAGSVALAFALCMAGGFAGGFFSGMKN